jgi:hypothetical protein
MHALESMFMLRMVRVIVVGLACTAGVFVLLLTPALVGLVPPRVARFWAEILAIACLLARALARRLAASEPGEGKATAWARAGLKQVDRLTDWALGGGLVWALGLLCLGLLLAWVPHYLTWPWSRDQETFAVLAQSWDEGVRPYREIRAYNFPGATYLAWALGKTFGWGNSVRLYAFDASCVVVLGVVLVCWSRRRLGGAIPGLISYLVFLSYYLSLSYDLVIERDWHTALLVCLGLMVMQTWPGRGARWVSALAAALALAIRPHAVLFLPALVWEAAHGADAAGPGPSGKVRSAVEWCLWWFLFVALAFAPLLVAGIAGDFIRGLRVAAYGGPYSKATPDERFSALVDQLRYWKTYVPLAATLLAAARPRDKYRAMAQTWSLAWLGVLVYRPLHPVHHLYLMIPTFLVGSITWAFAVAWALSFQRSHGHVVVLGVLVLAHEIMPAIPPMCDLNDSLRALPPLFRGEMPDRSPLGSLRPYVRALNRSARWDDYRELLKYLRSHTGPRTLIANVIDRFPYDTVNGPTGRLSPFLAESGLCWMTQVDIDLDPEFAESLQNATDSVVVWDPKQCLTDGGLRIKGIIAVIQRHYEPAARFGRFEVWKRKAPESP